MDNIWESIELVLGCSYVVLFLVTLILGISGLFIKDQKIKTRRTCWFLFAVLLKMSVLSIFGLVFLTTSNLERPERILYSVIYLMIFPGLVGSYYAFKGMRKKWLAIKSN